MFKQILNELRHHAPFTLFGALTGVALMAIVIYGRVPADVSNTIFYIFHPLHVVLSALVTTAIYRLRGGGVKSAVIIGYVGSIGVATISDIIFPYLGGVLLGMEMEFHLGFIDKWWLVNPLAFLGVVIAVKKPTTKIPHAGHVLLSTWASLFYLTAFGAGNWVPLFPLVFAILFIAVWVPCCVSDIVFPLLFVASCKEK